MTKAPQNYTCENIAYWTKRAPGYAQVNRDELGSRQRQVWSRALDSRIRAHFGRRPRGETAVLDVGTGPGFFAIILAELGYQVTAVDYTDAMLEQARENAGALAGRICFRQMDAEELTFPAGCFDVVVSRNLTWNLRAPERAYAHWTRVLKPGGLLLYATCTLNPAENGEVAARFLEAHPEFEPWPIRLPGVERLVDESPHTLTMLPFSGGSDGFFAARFRRKGEL